MLPVSSQKPTAIYATQWRATLVSSILAGFDTNGKPQIYQVDPSGTYFSWKANAIGGRNFKASRISRKGMGGGLDERNALTDSQDLLEVVDSGSKNMELVVKQSGAMAPLNEEELQSVTEEVEKRSKRQKTQVPK